MRRRKRPASGFRKFITGLAIALAGLVTAALILPGYIDWNRFKTSIETQASQSLGRQVRIAGDIHFALLPRPAISLEEITLPDSVNPAAPVLLSLDKLEMRISLLPLLSGDIQVEQFQLTAPKLHLERGKDGGNNWALPGGDLHGGVSKIRFDQISVTQGSLRYRDTVAGADFLLEQMDLQLSAESLHGPLTANGSLELQGVPVRFDAALGAIDLTQRQNPAPLRLKAVLGGEDEISYAGTISTDFGASGTLKAEGADLNHLTGTVFRLGGVPEIPQPRIFAHPYRFESSIALARDSLKFGKSRLSLGNETLTASLNIGGREGADFDLVVEAPSLNLDALLAPGSPVPKQTGFAMPEIWRASNGAVRFSAGDLQWRGGHIRNAGLTLLVSGNDIKVENFTAQLPGATSASISGTILMGESQPQFAGELALQTVNLRGLVEWLGVSTPDIQERSLAHGAVKSQFLLTPYQAELQDLSAEIDSTTLTGALAFAFRDRLAVGIDLRADKLNLDNYLPQQAASPAASPPGGDAPSSPFSGIPTLGSWLEGCDYNLKLSLDGLSYLGTPIEKLQIEGSLLNGTLVVNRFVLADMAGSAMSMSGILSNLTPDAQGEINFRLASKNLGVLADNAGVRLPVSGAKLGAAAIEAKLLLADKAAEISLDSTFGETFFRLSGKVSGLETGLLAAFGDDALFISEVTLGSRSLAKFAAQFGLPLTPSPETDMAGVGLTGILVRTPGEISLNMLSGAIGGLPVQGRATLRYGDAKPVFMAEVTAGEIFTDNYFTAPSGAAQAPSLRGALPWSGTPFDLGLLNEIDAEIILKAARMVYQGYDAVKPGLEFTAHHGNLQISNFNGRLFGGTFRAGAALNAGEPVPEFSAQWKLLDADMEAANIALTGAPVMTGRFDFSGQMKGAGASSFAIVSALEGSAHFSAHDGAARGLDLADFSRRLGELQRAGDFVGLAAPALKQGETPYSRIEIPFVIAQGVAQPQAPVIGIAGVQGELQAALDLPRYWLNAKASLSLQDHKGAPPIMLSYEGPLDQPVFALRYDQLENYFTQTLLSQSLERVINNRAAPAPAPAAPPPSDLPAAAAPAPQPQQIQPAPAAQPISPKPEKNPARKVLDGLLNGILDGDD